MFGIAPTAKAAHVLAAETGMPTDTVAKLLHEWTRADRLPDPRYRLPAGTTLVVDEARMIGTSSLHQLIHLADPDRLAARPRRRPPPAASGRAGRDVHRAVPHRPHPRAGPHPPLHPTWEADASLQLRAGRAEPSTSTSDHGRIHPGTLDDHLAAIAERWLALTGGRATVAVTASSNQHVDALNAAIQQARLDAGQLDPATAIPIAGGERRACR